MKQISRQSLVLLLLALLFLAPGITALCFFKHPQWLSKQATNRGEFVKPPLSVKALRQLSSKWHLVLWNPQHCDQQCEKRIDQLARVRLALGRRYYDVDQVLLTGEESPPMAEQLEKKLHHHGIEVLRAESNCAPDSKIFIANPDGYLVLSYTATAEADDIYHDLKQLLTTTQTQSN